MFQSSNSLLLLLCNYNSNLHEIEQIWHQINMIEISFPQSINSRTDPVLQHQIKLEKYLEIEYNEKMRGKGSAAVTIGSWSNSPEIRSASQKCLNQTELIDSLQNSTQSTQKWHGWSNSRQNTHTRLNWSSFNSQLNKITKTHPKANSDWKPENLSCHNWGRTWESKIKTHINFKDSMPQYCFL